MWRTLVSCSQDILETLDNHQSWSKEGTMDNQQQVHVWSCPANQQRQCLALLHVLLGCLGALLETMFTL